MAEGGLLQENKPGNDKASISPCRLLDCPICLEQMLQPKSLPCLHSFCEGCLGTYIVTDLSGEMAAATSFPCPVCRKITSPVDPSESKESWARQFPANDLVQDFIYLTKKSDNTTYCGPCKRTKNKDVPAKFYCRTTDTFCEVCKENFHDIVHQSCDIVAITKGSGSTLTTQATDKLCSTHNEKMDCYCESHKFIGCNKCIITAHRRCDAVTTTTGYFEKEKVTYLDEIERSLEKAFSCMELIGISFDDRDDFMKQCQENDLKGISDLRQRINAYLDKKQEDITQELVSKYKAEKAKVDLSRQKCRRLKVSIQSTREASMTAAKRKDHIKRIELFHRGQTEIRACNDLIDNMSSSKSVFIKLDIDTNLVKIDQTSPLSMGRILVEEQPSTLPDGVDFIQSEGTLSCSRVKELRKNIKIKIQSDKEECSIQGVVLMSNGNIVVSDYNNKCLKLFSSQGESLSVLKINGSPYDVCLVDDSTVAVAVAVAVAVSMYNKQTGIHIVKVQDSMLRLSSVIKMPNKCHGITYVDGTFMVSTLNYVYRVGMDGKSEKFHQLLNNCYHLVCCPNQKGTFSSLSTSTANDVAITKLSTDVQTCIMRVGLVKNGMGIDVDRDGNLYVCGQVSNNVVQMSPDGIQIRELLTSADGIEKPRAISVCGDKFVVTNESSKNRNCINVYKLF